MHEDDGKTKVYGGGICGIGEVAGIRCMISASNSAIKGGTVTPMGVEKTLRAQAIAREQKLPIVSLVESGGANLLFQSQMFVRGGASFCNQARRVSSRALGLRHHGAREGQGLSRRAAPAARRNRRDRKRRGARRRGDARERFRRRRLHRR
jgi:hypothetical protein